MKINHHINFSLQISVFHSTGPRCDICTHGRVGIFSFVYINVKMMWRLGFPTFSLSLVFSPNVEGKTLEIKKKGAKKPEKMTQKLFVQLDFQISNTSKIVAAPILRINFHCFRIANFVFFEQMSINSLGKKQCQWLFKWFFDS